ncbi:MAG TPA: YibE/F family protein [Candidatus Paceibacterota bacterium]|nr:YibE/F family protein [Candidatus Paceibacterota bacterium]
MARWLAQPLIVLSCLAALCAPSTLQAQEVVTEQVHLLKAKVLEVLAEDEVVEPWSGLTSPTQTIRIEVLEGAEKGQVVTIENDYTQLKEGQTFYVRHAFGGFDAETWSVADPYRLDVLIGVAVAFVLLLFAFGGIQGIRGLASLLGSLVLIFYLLIPNIFLGHSPVLVSIGVSSLIIVIGSYITHGFNRTTTIAMFGMLATVLITGIATYFVIDAAQLTGFTTEENAYLNFGTQGRIDMIGLLFGGIMIGLLGVLYDIAIGQAITVEELAAAGVHYSKKQVLARGMRVGREHIGALVNTLAIAYVGASLPLLLLFQHSGAGVAYIINSELFATEIIRILMGSIGLVLAVPITTVLATYLLYGKVPHRTSEHHGHKH